MKPAEMLTSFAIDSDQPAPEVETGDEVRRLRRAMRLHPTQLVRKTRLALPTAKVGGAALLAGGFCLGWKAFRYWYH